MGFVKSLIGAGESVAKVAAPIVAGAFGGPLAAAAVAGAESKIPQIGAVAKPSSAGSISQARVQDKQRMASKYPGAGPNL
jgi:hypothetical protein